MFVHKKHLLGAFFGHLKPRVERSNRLREQQTGDYVGFFSAVEFVALVYGLQGHLLNKNSYIGCLPCSPCSAMAELSWVIYTVLEVLIAVACCLGNVLVVCAVCVGIRDSLREPTFCFLVSLAVADFLVGVAAVPLAVVLDGWVSLTPYLCLLLSCVVLVLTQASVLSLLAIAVDRYLRLHTPLR